MSQFTEVERSTGTVWLHNDKPVWIVRYGPTPVRLAHYQAYKATAKVPTGRDPWSVDNRRMSEDGWPTLEQAMEAVK